MSRGCSGCCLVSLLASLEGGGASGKKEGQPQGHQGQSFPGQALTNCQVWDLARRVIKIQHDFWVWRSDKVLDDREIEHGPKGTRGDPGHPGVFCRAIFHTLALWVWLRG